MGDSVGIVGAGSWGSAIAQHLSFNGSEVTIWGRDKAVLKEISEENRNSRYLGEISLSSKIKCTDSISELIKNNNILVFSLPSRVTRAALIDLCDYDFSGKALINASKGLESETSLRGSEVISQLVCRQRPVWALSGPSFAHELAMGLPTALVLASDRSEPELEKRATALFHRGTVRVYSSNDIIGVELGGVLKNVIALAAGIGDGLGLGLNARAALLTRGLREISALIEIEGGKASTVIGLSGLGDLILTATGDLSRNRKFGIALGRGLSIKEAIEEVGYTIEALTSAEAARKLALRHNLEVPIIEQVAYVLSGDKTPAGALRDLMTREQRSE